MNNKKYFIYAGYLLAVMLLFYVGFRVWGDPVIENTENIEYPPQTQGSTMLGDVSITLTPVNIGEERLEFSISITTHSVALDGIDLGSVTVLEYGDRRITPSEYPTMAGHHAAGTLAFPVKEKPKNFRITINSIPQDQIKVFEW